MTASGGSFNALNQLLVAGSVGTTRFRGSTDEAADVTVAGQPTAAYLQGDGSQRFEADVALATGTQTVTVAATDQSGNANASSQDFSVEVAAPGSRTLSYDGNGNLLSDGERTYTWNGLDQLVKIGYVGDTDRFTPTFV